MALATLSIDVLAKLASFEAGMDKAARIAAKAADDVQRRWDKLGAGLAAVGGALGTVLGSAALATIARDTINSIDALNDLKDATGASIENLSALEDVALRTGTSMDTVGAAVLKLNKFLSEAEPNSAQANMLKQLGLDAAALRREDPAEALRQVAVALSEFEDDGNKARFAQELLGKSIKDVMPLLNDLAGTTKLVGTVTAEQAAEAEKFNKQIAAMEKNALDLKRALASELLPTLNQYLVLIAQITKGPGWIASVGEVFRGNSFRSAGDGLSFYSKELAKVDAQIKALETDNPRSIFDRSKGVNDGQIASLQKDRARLAQFADLYRNVLNSDGAGAGRGSVSQLSARASLPAAPIRADAPAVKAAAKDADTAAKAYETLISKIQQRMDLTLIELQTGDKATEAERLRIEVLKELDKAQALDADPARAALKAVQVRAALDAVTTVIRTTEAQRELQQTLRATARIEQEQVARLSAEAERRAGLTQQLRDQYELYGLTAEQIEAVQIRRMEEALATERQALAMAQNAEASAADITERERIIRLLEEEIGLRAALAERARLDATDPLRGATRALADYQDEIARTGDSTYSLLRSGIDGFEQRTAEMLVRGKADWRAYFTQIALEAAKVNLVRPGLNSLINLGLGLLTGGPGIGITGANTGGAGLVDLGLGAGRAYGGPVGPRELRPIVERGLPEVLDTPDGTWLITGSKGGTVRALDKRAGSSAVQTPARMSVTVVNTGAPVQVTGQRQLSDSELMLMIDNSRQAAVEASAALMRNSVATPNGDMHRTLRSTFNLQPKR